MAFESIHVWVSFATSNRIGSVPTLKKVEVLSGTQIVVVSETGGVETVTDFDLSNTPELVGYSIQNEYSDILYGLDVGTDMNLNVKLAGGVTGTEIPPPLEGEYSAFPAYPYLAEGETATAIATEEATQPSWSPTATCAADAVKHQFKLQLRESAVQFVLANPTGNAETYGKALIGYCYREIDSCGLPGAMAEDELATLVGKIDDAIPSPAAIVDFQYKADATTWSGYFAAYEVRIAEMDSDRNIVAQELVSTETRDTWNTLIDTHYVNALEY